MPSRLSKPAGRPAYASIPDLGLRGRPEARTGSRGGRPRAARAPAHARGGPCPITRTTRGFGTLNVRRTPTLRIARTDDRPGARSSLVMMAPKPGTVKLGRWMQTLPWRNATPKAPSKTLGHRPSRSRRPQRPTFANTHPPWCTTTAVPVHRLEPSVRRVARCWSTRITTALGTATAPVARSSGSGSHNAVSMRASSPATPGSACRSRSTRANGPDGTRRAESDEGDLPLASTTRNRLARRSRSVTTIMGRVPSGNEGSDGP